MVRTWHPEFGSASHNAVGVLVTTFSIDFLSSLGKEEDRLVTDKSDFRLAS
jgi:hypothetical protein